MSHFTVLCITNNFEEVKEQLEPFYELECSMNQNEMKNDPRATFKKEFTTDELEQDYFKTINNHPDYHYNSIEEYAENYHGYQKLENQEIWGRWTNVNSKWDWYQVGGRWTGFFKVKDKPKYPDDLRIGSYSLVSNRQAENGYVDTIRLCDIDFEGMIIDHINSLKNNWKEIEKGLEEKEEYIRYVYDLKPDETEETYINRPFTFATYALLKDGVWYEKGEMGWWGISTNDKEDWDQEFYKLIESLPEDTLLTIVDCHI